MLMKSFLQTDIEPCSADGILEEISSKMIRELVRLRAVLPSYWTKEEDHRMSCLLNLEGVTMWNNKVMGYPPL